MTKNRIFIEYELVNRYSYVMASFAVTVHDAFYKALYSYGTAESTEKANRLTAEFPYLLSSDFFQIENINLTVDLVERLIEDLYHIKNQPHKRGQDLKSHFALDYNCLLVLQRFYHMYWEEAIVEDPWDDEMHDEFEVFLDQAIRLCETGIQYAQKIIN